MFDLITQSMLFLLESLKTIVGNYGLAIVVLTVLVRIALWPVSKSQMKSMKAMQDLQPKMKALQERYKSDPQKLQMEMLKLYKENKFNPLGGCLPMLIQLPLFIGLYWAISHPQFMATGDPTFLNFIHLKNTGIVSHAGPSNNGQMSLGAGGGGFLGTGKDHLIAGPEVTFVLKKNGELLKQKIPHPNEALTILPKEPRPGIPLQISTSYSKLGIEGYEGLIEDVRLQVINSGTKETELIRFQPAGMRSTLTTTLETVPGKTVPHFDVLLLVVVFAVTMIISQRMMTSQAASTASEQQQQIMKLMPIMFSVFLFIFPIPAGVLLYMDTNSFFQIFQTWMFQRGGSSEDSKSSPPSQRILDVKPDRPNA